MKTSRLIGALVLVLTMAAPLAVRAQEINLSAIDEGPTNRVQVRTGAEYGFVAGLGYARTLAVPGVERPVLVTGELTAPWAHVDASDYRLRLGALVPIAGAGPWRVAGSLAPTLRHTKNDVAVMTSLGADVGVVGGYYARHWFTAGEVGYDWIGTTHITSSDLYRRFVYANARDGWYGEGASGNLRAGIQAGATFSRYDLALRAGALRDVAGEAPLLPFYATLGLSTRF